MAVALLGNEIFSALQNVSRSITVPSGTTYILVWLNGYPARTISNVQVGGNACTLLQSGTPGGSFTALYGIAYSTQGSVTLSATVSSAFDEGAIWGVAYFSGVDTTHPIHDSDVASSPYSASLDCNVGDYAFICVGGDLWPELTSNLTTINTLNELSQIGRMGGASINSSGTVSIGTTNGQYSTQIACVLNKVIQAILWKDGQPVAYYDMDASPTPLWVYGVPMLNYQYTGIDEENPDEENPYITNQAFIKNPRVTRPNVTEIMPNNYSVPIFKSYLGWGGVTPVYVDTALDILNYNEFDCVAYRTRLENVDILTYNEILNWINCTRSSSVNILTYNEILNEVNRIRSFAVDILTYNQIAILAGFIRSVAVNVDNYNEIECDVTRIRDISINLIAYTDFLMLLERSRSVPVTINTNNAISIQLQNLISASLLIDTLNSINCSAVRLTNVGFSVDCINEIEMVTIRIKNSSVDVTNNGYIDIVVSKIAIVSALIEAFAIVQITPGKDVYLLITDAVVFDDKIFIKQLNVSDNVILGSIGLSIEDVTNAMTFDDVVAESIKISDSDILKEINF